jgi:hypothetical protein
VIIMPVPQRPLTGGLVLAGLLMTGCATAPRQDPQASQPHCLKNRLGRTTLCTASPAPPLAHEADVKRMAPDPKRLTVFVVRNSWGDTRHRIRITGVGEPEPELIPRTFARLTLAPGRHQLSFDFEGRAMSKSIQGQAGEVVFAAIEGTAWAWGGGYAWSDESAERTRQRVMKSRLVFDR